MDDSPIGFSKGTNSAAPKQGRWARHQRDNGTGPFQNRPEPLLSGVLTGVLKIHGREMSRVRLDGNLEPSSPLLRSEGDNICTGGTAGPLCH